MCDCVAILRDYEVCIEVMRIRTKHPGHTSRDVSSACPIKRMKPYRINGFAGGLDDDDALLSAMRTDVSQSHVCWRIFTLCHHCMKRLCLRHHMYCCRRGAAPLCRDQTPYWQQCWLCGFFFVFCFFFRSFVFFYVICACARSSRFPGHAP